MGNSERCGLGGHQCYGLVGIASTFSRYYRVNVATPHPLRVVRQPSSSAFHHNEVGTLIPCESVVISHPVITSASQKG